MTSYAIGIELGGSRGRCARADDKETAVVVDVAMAVALDEARSVVVGDAATGMDEAVTKFVGQLGRAEPFLVRGTPYGAEALVAQMLRHVFDAASTGAAPVVTALVHDDEWGEYQLDLLREAVRLSAVGPVHLLPAAAASSYDADDLAVGAARWAWERRDDGAAVPVPGSPVSARTVLLGVGAGAGGLLAVGGGTAVAGAAGGAGAATGSTLADFAGQGGGATLGDFASQAGRSTLEDFAGPGRGSTLHDFADQGGGSKLGDFAQPETSPAKTTSVAKRTFPKVPAAIAVAVVAVGVIAGVALAASGDDDAPEQAAATTTTEAEASSTTAAGATATTVAAAGNPRLATPFLFVCGGVGPAGAGTGGRALEASCGRPLDITVADDGTAWFTDQHISGTAPSAVRAVLPDGTLRSYDLGEVDGERIDRPSALAVADDGTLYVADPEHSRILRRTPSGIVSRYAGTADGRSAGNVSSGSPVPIAYGVAADEAALGPIDSLALSDDGSLYLADVHNDLVQRIAPDGTITVVAGRDRTASDPGAASIPANDANLTALLQGGPTAVELDPKGVLHIAGEQSVWRLEGGALTRVAGSGDRPGDDSPTTVADALEAELWISDIAFGPDGTLYVAEVTDRADVWALTLGGGGRRVIGGLRTRTADDVPTADRVLPWRIDVDDDGRLLVTEAGSNYEMVRRFPSPS